MDQRGQQVPRPLVARQEQRKRCQHPSCERPGKQTRLGWLCFSHWAAKMDEIKRQRAAKRSAPTPNRAKKKIKRRRRRPLDGVEDFGLIEDSYFDRRA